MIGVTPYSKYFIEIPIYEKLFRQMVLLPPATLNLASKGKLQIFFQLYEVNFAKIIGIILAIFICTHDEKLNSCSISLPKTLFLRRDERLVSKLAS